MTIIGLNKWAEDHGGDLFANLTLPGGMVKQTLVNNIIMQAAPFEVYYPDPDVMTEAIGFWSAANLEKWNRWADSWTKANAFNQLENFDRSETEDITHSGKDVSGNLQTRNLSGTDNRTQNLTDGETRNLTDELKKSAYDSSAYSPYEQTTHTGTDTVTHTGTDNRSMTDGGTVLDQGDFTHGHKIGRTARFHGNIGVTSLAQLLEGYNAAAEKWDLYARITQDFLQEFCILVY